MKNILKLFLFLILLTSVCYSQAEQTPVISEVHPELKNIPIYPNSDGIMDGNPNWVITKRKVTQFIHISQKP